MFRDTVSAWASNGKSKVNSEVEAVSRQRSGSLIGVQREEEEEEEEEEKKKKKKKMMMMMMMM